MASLSVIWGRIYNELISGIKIWRASTIHNTREIIIISKLLFNLDVALLLFKLLTAY